MRPPAGPAAARRTWLFDLDGTLVDSGPAHEAAFRQAIAEVAPALLASFRYADHAGATTGAVAARLAGPGQVADRLAERKRRLYRELVAAGRVTVFPGARRLLDHLARGGHAVHLVTSGSRGSVRRVLAHCSLAGHFGHVLTGDDVPVSKPDPRFYAEACRRFGVDPAAAVAVEDSAHGVASAVGAGLLTLQVHADRPAPGAVAAGDLTRIIGLLDREVMGHG
ncbi:haloacid dehalogenase [Sphaerisporangium rufum]|uniref:Haloacid dehalogenase n=1 Tax=Sphaerisporangium rufum TaxID=1381558 RepID=A0A919R0E5_9ACTN|nr:HAD family phosphatase [Sphaerisporangium rufum]GII77359.1 haloacid dehalogenase [Sphaerisporangium rufum]